MCSYGLLDLIYLTGAKKKKQDKKLALLNDSHNSGLYDYN